MYTYIYIHTHAHVCIHIYIYTCISTPYVRNIHTMCQFFSMHVYARLLTLLTAPDSRRPQGFGLGRQGRGGVGHGDQGLQVAVTGILAEHASIPICSSPSTAAIVEACLISDPEVSFLRWQHQSCTLHLRLLVLIARRGLRLWLPKTSTGPKPSSSILHARRRKLIAAAAKQALHSQPSHARTLHSVGKRLAWLSGAALCGICVILTGSSSQHFPRTSC